MGNLTGSKDKRKSKLGKKLTFSKYTFQIRCLMVVNYGTSTWYLSKCRYVILQIRVLTLVGNSLFFSNLVTALSPEKNLSTQI